MQTLGRREVDKLFNLMVASRKSAAVEFVRDLIEEHADENLILSEVLNPALIKIGNSWGQRKISLSQSFVCAKIAEEILNQCVGGVRSERNENLKAVIGNIEDDFHSLGRKIVANFLKAQGWTIYDLGNDVTPGRFVEQALEHGASIIGVSAMMQSTALNISRVRELIDNQNLQNAIKLAVGGAVFAWRPELAERVGADGTAAHAGLVNDLFLNLNQSASR